MIGVTGQGDEEWDMGLTDEGDRALRAELGRMAPLLAMAHADDQERILDHAFTLAGIDPERADWLHYACLYLTEYRQQGDRDAPAPR